MGFSVSWLAVQLDKEQTLKRAGLIDTGVVDEANEEPFSVAELPNGWTVIFSQDVGYASEKRVLALSAGTQAIACRVDEGSMNSGIHCATNGTSSWSVWHDGQIGVHNVQSSGLPPLELHQIAKRLREEHDAAEGTAAGVDYGFDIPLELVALLTGYRHDLVEFDWGEPIFTAAEPTQAIGKPWWRRWW